MKVRLLTQEEFKQEWEQGSQPKRPRDRLQNDLKASSTLAGASTDNKKNDFGYSRPAPKPQPKKKGATKKT